MDVLFNKKLNNILSAVCIIEEVRPSDLKGRSRTRALVDVRKLFVYFARAIHPGISYEQIGLFLNRDHSTTSEIKTGFGEYFFADITGSYQEEIKEIDNFKQEITKIKTIYEVTPLPYKILGVVEKYVDSLNVVLNFDFPPNSQHLRMLDKVNYLSDFKLDLINQGKI